MDKILNRGELVSLRNKAGEEGKKVVFTNGCYDILHRGHVELFRKAKALGDVLIVGINSDSSVKKLKGNERPVVNEDDRAYVIASLECVDAVCLFEEETPAELIMEVKPDILVKGGDYAIDEIVGRETVWENGGEVLTIPLIEGRSTSDIIKKIVSLYGKEK